MFITQIMMYNNKYIYIYLYIIAKKYIFEIYTILDLFPIVQKLKLHSSKTLQLNRLVLNFSVELNTG